MSSRPLRLAVIAVMLMSGIGLAAALVSLPLATTLNDYVQPGTQPLGLSDSVLDSPNCAPCHGNYDPNQEPYTRWAASMMAQAGRDPMFYAALAIAEQDASFSGDMCLRCHTPGAWLDGRSSPTDGSALDNSLGDLDGVTCHLCHRLVDPVYESGVNPPEDAGILASLADVPVNNGNGQYVVDPYDRRRGPFDLGPSFSMHAWRESPYHREALLCGTCHDVSNPAFTRQLDGSYALNTLNVEHPTQDKYDEFPVERTYSEWTQSAFAQGPIEMGGRFGGNITAVSTCQDCHMPKTTGTACQPVLGGAIRPDLPLHDFNGTNSWVLDSVRSLYPDSETGLTTASVAAAHARNLYLHQNAADLESAVVGTNLVVRVVNQTGHKLPSGYSEGRRMWINVKFYNASNVLVGERGAYNTATATLTTGDTKVYEQELGVDAAQAAQTGLPTGPTFHFVLNNKVFKDNRIPPRGFTNAGFQSIQSGPVAATFAEEQYWDDTNFVIPPTATRAEVALYHQTTSRQYAEFLRDTNTTNGAGLLAYNEWVSNGKSAPVLKENETVYMTSATCLPPIAYGTSKTLSNGNVPSLGWSGTPSLSANNFNLELQNCVPNSVGLVTSSKLGFVFSSPTSASTPFAGGTMLLGGSPTLVGRFAFRPTGQATFPLPVTAPMVGTALNYQVFFRERSVSAPYGITNAVHVNFCP